MNEIVSEFRDSIDEELVRRKFSSLNDDEIPVWMGSPTVLSYSPRYLLAVIIFSVHFIFYRVAVTIFAEGKEGFFYTFLRIIDQLFDLIDVFAFIIVMLFIARINHFLNISTSSLRTTFFLIIVGLIPSVWYIVNIIDWILVLIGREGINIPEWFGTVLGCSECILGKSKSLTLTKFWLHFSLFLRLCSPLNSKNRFRAKYI